VNPEAATTVQQAMRFAQPQVLWLLFVVPVAILFVVLGMRARSRARMTWAGSLFERLTSGLDPGRERLRWGLYLAGFTCVVVALARPQWGGETVMMKRKGIDVLVALDTSNSMLAEDMRPNRLASAKRAIADLVHRMGGDRLGLLAFAGEGYVVCPLTLDHGTVLLLLESMNPTTVSVQGSNLEDAIRRARAAFVTKETKHKALVLVTDGESTSGDPVREAEQAAEEGVVIHAIGIGSPDGQPIPERDDRGAVTGYKRDRGGQVVNSRLDEATLRRIAEATRGRYYRASAQGVELNAVVAELQSLEKKELEGQLATHYEERYQWPLALAALLLALEVVIPNRRRRRVATAAVLCAGALAVASDAGAVPRRAVRLNGQANRAYDAKQWDEASKLYDEAQVQAPESPEIAYNLGNAMYRQGKFGDAIAHLRRAAESDDPTLRQQSFYNLGNALHDSGDLQRAVQAYRAALRLDPRDHDAKVNYEKTRQELQQQQQSGGGQSKDQDPSQQNQNQQGQSQGGQGQNQESGQGDEQQQAQNEPGSEQGERDRQQGDEQPQPRDEAQSQQPGGDAQQQMAALDSMPGGLTREEALRILEAMRQQEKELQQQRARKAQARTRRVDKDW
jgi:Ca-activated chloride channel family protein